MIGAARIAGRAALWVALTGDMGCGNCPQPRFGTPRVEGGPCLGADAASLVVGWDRASDDQLPDAYYQRALQGLSSDGANCSAVSPPNPPAFRCRARSSSTLFPASVTLRSGSGRELVLEFEGLDQYFRTRKAIVLPLRYADARGIVDCHHPGMFDTHHLLLTLEFDAHRCLEKVSFSPTTTSYGPL